MKFKSKTTENGMHLRRRFRPASVEAERALDIVQLLAEYLLEADK